MNQLQASANVQRRWCRTHALGAPSAEVCVLVNNHAPPHPPPPPPPGGHQPGPTVGSFRRGLRMLPDAIERNIKDTIR
jgi:hypothetical protein